MGYFENDQEARDGKDVSDFLTIPDGGRANIVLIGRWYEFRTHFDASGGRPKKCIGEGCAVCAKGGSAGRANQRYVITAFNFALARPKLQAYELATSTYDLIDKCIQKHGRDCVIEIERTGIRQSTKWFAQYDRALSAQEVEQFAAMQPLDLDKMFSPNDEDQAFCGNSAGFSGWHNKTFDPSAPLDDDEVDTLRSSLMQLSDDQRARFYADTYSKDALRKITKGDIESVKYAISAAKNNEESLVDDLPF